MFKPKSYHLGTRRPGLLLFAFLNGILVGALFNLAASAQAETKDTSQWIRPRAASDPLIWGRGDGIVFGLPSDGGLRGPRGLIRIGVISPETGRPELLNYVAIEPVTAGHGNRFSRMAFSELEPSRLDPGQRGKRLWVDLNSNDSENIAAGKLEAFPSKSGVIERLSVQIDVERFSANDAHVYVVASIDSDRPKEVNLSVYQYDDSPHVEELTLTATMGNYERLRLLWLNHCILDSRQLFASYAGDAFIEQGNYPLNDMLRTDDGDAIVLGATNEDTPSSFPGTPLGHWHYPLPKLTQYWRVSAHDIQPDLRVRVNARRVYWASHDLVPGGVAFENFEVRQRYIRGQTFTFGVTEKNPWQFEPAIRNAVSPGTGAGCFECQGAKSP